jgi:glycosyltransferase involved in cell wall biosynthesis
VLAGSYDRQDMEYADAELLARAEKDGIIERHGHINDIRPLMASADCVVLPSYYREGVPRSLLEAASMGKPLIAADSAGTREPVRDGVNGFLCRPRDPADLARKMEAMIAMSPEQRGGMGAASRSYMIQRFDERIVIQTYLDAIERLIGPAGTQS